MKPVHADNANTVIGGAGHDSLPALLVDGTVYTIWELDDDEREALANGGCVLLAVKVGDSGWFQPVALTVQPAEAT